MIGSASNGGTVSAADGNHPRAPRNSLTDQRILLEALALVDETGLEGLTTRALGHRLGVDSTAVYRHFRSRNELLSALADHIMGNASQPPPGNNGDGSLRGQLRGACLCLRRALLAHPAMTAIVVRRPPRGTGTWAATEHALGLLRQAGLSDQDAARAYQALLSYTLGHAMLEAPYAALDAEQAAAELAASRLGQASLPASRYPNTAAVAPHLYGSLEEQFSYGLDRLLDGLGLGAGDHIPMTIPASGSPTTQSHA
jgi:TetR/AcrR family transcriptional regulator, tetracycline repressor protein